MHYKGMHDVHLVPEFIVYWISIYLEDFFFFFFCLIIIFSSYAFESLSKKGLLHHGLEITFLELSGN